MSISRKAEDDELPCSSPLLSKPRKPLTTNNTPLFTCLLMSTLVSLSAAIVFGCLFFSSSVSTVSRPLSKLKHPVVLLVSFDGFRFGYQFKTDTPNIHSLIRDGTEAEQGLIPVFPTATFPNHYSIVTGLYPAHHGIIYNFFPDPVNSSTDYFTTRSHEPKWWLGEPLWQTVVKNGLKASAYFWPGSEVKKGSWDCPQEFCPKYNYSAPFDDRVDTVLSYFDLPSEEMPSFMALYFEDPDSQGHQVGPDHPNITASVANVDKVVGRLITGLKNRGIFEDVHLIVVGDHGMVGTCDKRVILLDDLAEWIKIPAEWVQSYTPLLSIRPPSNYSSADVVAKMNEGLKSGKVNNGEYLQVYLKEDLPARLHYSASDRIAPIIGLVGEGFKIQQAKTEAQECAGAHGYDNAYFSMRTIFFGHGPRFAKGRKVASFENVEIYNLVTKILKIKGAPNNGTASFPNNVLLPSR